MVAFRLDVHGFRQADPAEVRSGLLGYLQLVVSEALVLDGITLRRTERGHIGLSFPCRTDGQGRRHPLIRPTDQQVREALEQAVVARLGLQRGRQP